MRLTYLSVEGFRCFAEAQRIDFPATGIIPIVGVRPDGGSSGSGKTSVFQALAWALGFSSFSATKQQSWLTKTPAQVAVGLATEDGTDVIDIYRGKKTKVVKNGEEVATGATETNKWLVTYFGMDPKLLQTLTFRPQRKGGLFMGLGPAEKRVFLASVLRFTRFEEMAEQLGKEIAQLQRTIAIQTNAINLVTLPPMPSVQPTTSITLNDGIVTGDYTNLDWNEFKNAYEEMRLRAEGSLAELAERLDKHRKQQSAFNAQAYEKVAAVSRELGQELAKIVPVEAQGLEDIERALGLCNERVKQLTQKQRELEAERALINEELVECSTRGYTLEREVTQANYKLRDAKQLKDALTEQLCHTCGQPWKDEMKLTQAQADHLVAYGEESRAIAALDALQRRKDELTVVRSQLEPKIKKVVEGIDKFRAEASKLQQQVSDAKVAAIRATEAQKDALRERYKKLEADAQRNAYEGRDLHDQKVADCSAAVEAARRAVYQIEAKADVTRQKLQSIKRQNDSIAELWAIYNSARLKIEKAEAELKKAEVELQEKTDLQAATRGFLGAISEEVLAEIREEANLMLASIPNVQGVGIRFATETLGSTGNIRQEIRTVLTYGQEDDIDAEAQLSGGQLTSVELAVDRAVSKVLRRRHGGYRLPSWVCLDESFDGHGPIEKEACFDFLRAETQDSQVFIIDHSSEFRDAFEHTITVTAGDGGSKISID